MSSTNKTSYSPNVNGTCKKNLQNENTVDNIFMQAFYHCTDLLEENINIVDNFDKPISKRSLIYGKKMFEFMQNTRRKLIDEQNERLNKLLSIKNEQKNNNLLECWVYINSKEKNAAENFLKPKQLEIKQEIEVNVIDGSEAEDNNNNNNDNNNDDDGNDDDDELPSRRMTTRRSVRPSSSILCDENSDNDFDCDDDQDEDYSADDNNNYDSDDCHDLNDSSDNENDDSSINNSSFEKSTNKRSRPIKPLGDKNKKTNKEREKDKEVLFQCRSKKPSTSIPYEMKVKVLKLLDKNPDWSLKQLRQHSGCSKIQDHHQLRKWKDQVKKYEESKSSKSPKQREFIPLDMKIKIVNMAKKHPEWSIKTLQEKTGCPLIERRQQLNLWNEHIQAGGSQKERNQKIFKWVYEKCIEKKKQNNKTKITTNEIMEWSYEAHKLFFPNIPIKYKNRTNEKSSWVANFKRYYPDYQVSDDEESDELNKENNPDESTAVKKKKKRTSTYKLEPVSNEDKIKVIKLVNDNPNWSMEKIRQVSGCSKVYNRKQVLSWTKSIKHGSHFDKKNERDRLVYKKCKKYTENVKKKFSNDLLCQWGKEANKIIVPNDDNNLMFSIGEKWLTRFKGVYKIIGKSPNLQLSKESPGDKNKTTDTVSRKNNCSDDDTDGDDDDDASNDISKIDSNVLADKVKRKPRYFASYDEKIKVLKTFKKHPGISLEELKKKTGCKYLYTINQLNRWVDHVKIGGSFTNKRTKICRSVYAKCIEYRDKNKKITYGLLRKWANEAYNKMPDDAKKNMKFCASTTWILNFKKNYGIFGLPTDLKIGDLPAGNNLNVNNNGGGEQSSDNVALIKSFKPAKPTCTRIPLDTAMKVLNLSYKHPNWDLKKLRKYSKCRKLVSFNQLLRWEKIIKNSKTFSKKCESMDRWILARCIEYKNKNYLITDKIIIGWALEAKRIFCNLSANHFATVPWLNNFKSKNKITGESSDLKIRN